ncbi:12 KDa protein, partial [Verbena latent virus]
MPLIAPPDNTRTFLCLAVGISLSLFIGLYTRNTLPHVGDLHHSLPHGGFYRDGTKTISYLKPNKLNSVEGHQKHFATQP